jgi:hypothetical protein
MAKLIPNPSFSRDCGVCLRTLERWDKRRASAIAAREAGRLLTPTDELMLALPAAIYINRRIYRDERAAAEFHQALMKQAVKAASNPQPRTAAPSTSTSV